MLKPLEGIRNRFEQERGATFRFDVVQPVTNVTTSDVTLWTVTADKFLRIEDIGVCNVSGADITVTVYLVPSGGSAAVTNAVYYNYPVLANDSGTLTAIIGTTLKDGDKIIADTSNATGANFWMAGYEFTGGIPR